jgi:methionine sulfoxide reductase heme-binding subunit
MKLDRKQKTQVIRISGHAASLIPLALLLYDYYFGLFSADVIREITLRTGKAAIVLLVLSLAITPFKIVFGWNQLHSLRRIFGLYAFMYVALHLTIFVYLDYGLSWPLLQEAIFEKRYALVGFAAFLVLLPLALTSSKWSMKKLGKKWTTLHKWVYLAGVLAVLHYILLVKNTYTQPFIFALILGVLLALRIGPVKQWVIRQRKSWGKRQSQPSVNS